MSGQTAIPKPRLVCKHCGAADSFYIEGVIEAWQDIAVGLDDEGKPDWDVTGRIEHNGDLDQDQFACAECRHGARRLIDLVVTEDPEVPIAPCGRCDHGLGAHPQVGYGKRGPYERPPMPCTHDGCDCHDYYDLRLAEAGNEDVRRAIAA